MKRYIFGTALAALVMLSSCEVIQPQEDVFPEDGVISGNVMVDSPQLDTVVFTATIGADTKTNLQWSDESQTYKTIWTDYDYIYVTGEDGSWYQFNVTDGVGTSTAKFKGTIPQSSVYTAVYGLAGWGDPEYSGVYLFYNQLMDYNQNGEHTFVNLVSPMAARSTSNVFEFKNLCSVLKVCITGNGEELNSVVFRPNDNDMAVCGSADIAFAEDGEPYFSAIYKESDHILFGANGQYIGPYETNAYIVLPPGLYEGGFELEIMTDKGGMTVSTSDDLYLERSTVYNVNVAYETEYINEQYWQLEVTEDGGESWNAYQMEYEDGMYVMKDWYFNDGVEFRFFETLTEVWYGCPGTFRRGAGKTNTRVDLASGEGWWWFQIYDPGYYDIYIDPIERCAYVMSDGFTPYDIPTRENVLYDEYYTLYKNAVERQYIKMYGAVIAKCGWGFILAIDGLRSNSVFVYDRNLCDVELGNWIDIYAKLAYYRDLPELVVNEGEYWMHVLDDTYNDYEPETPYIITDPSSFASSAYTYIKYVGTLNISGSHPNIIFEGNTQFKGSITSPLQDLTQFDGERVVVEGYYAGSNTSGDVTYINTIMKRIYPMEENGSSTEDIIPGESFPVTRPRAGFGGQTSVMGSPSPVMRELSYQFYPER